MKNVTPAASDDLTPGDKTRVSGIASTSSVAGRLEEGQTSNATPDSNPYRSKIRQPSSVILELYVLDNRGRELLDQMVTGLVASLSFHASLK